MNKDDIIYVILLLLGIAFGHYYRRIKDVALKKLVGTGFGLAIILFTSGLQSIHLFFTFLICFAIIKYNKKQCHLICFWFMMLYLLFFRTVEYFGLPTPPGHLNMIIMIMTLKVIGLSFEANTVYTKSREADKNEDKKEDLTPVEKEILNVSLADSFHYCFNYIGLLTGPYYTYRTFYDYFNLPFAANAENSFKVTLNKLKWVPLFIFFFFGTSYIWPLDYAMSSEFYADRSWLYRLFYVWPSFFIFRMRIYSGVTLSDCICTSAGFGAYPKELEAKCGHGPSKEVTKEILESPENREYDFETIENVYVVGVERCWTFREAMKHWNRCVQFWLAMYVYKRFPSKKYRVLATMAVSAYWHGVHAGYYFCIMGPIVYLPVEDLYTKVFKNEKASQLQQQITNIIFWILKFFAFSYLSIAFLLKDVDKIWYYYKSVYNFAYIAWAVMYAVCFVLWKKKKSAMKKASKVEIQTAEVDKKSN